MNDQVAKDLGIEMIRIAKSATPVRQYWRCGVLLLVSLPGTLLLPCAHAQNAAQRAALSRLGVHAQIVSGAEATSVPLARPGGLAFDSAGNLYIADTNDHIIREVDLAGIITTVAGTGEQGFSGDGGPATKADLDSPVGVAVDTSNNIYVADTHNQRLRMVNVSTGVINTIAGTGTAGFGGDGGAAFSAQLDLPTAIAVDTKGNIFVADTNNNRIREISGGIITTVAGNGTEMYSGDGGLATAAGLDAPNGIAVDSASNLYIGDTHNQRVRMVTASTGIITTIAGTGAKTFTGDGQASTAALARPSGVAVNGAGEILVADTDNDRIRKISGGTIATIAGDGMEGFSGDKATATSAAIDAPRAVATSGSSVMFADTLNNRVRAVNNNVVNTVAGLAPPSAEQIAFQGAGSGNYGSGSLAVIFANNGLTATGSVAFFDGIGSNPVELGSASLSSNSATLDTRHLSAGTHYLIAAYAGDVNNPAITSGVYVYVIMPAQLLAVAPSTKMLYGQAVPLLSGTLTGVLTWDAGNVNADFTTTATMTAAPGTYPIGVSLTGSAAGNYNVSLGAGSGTVSISQAPSTTTLSASSPTPFAGAPLTLTAAVASGTSGTPTGTVNFFDGATPLNSTPVALSGGIAKLTISSLPVGAASLNAAYSGDIDFQPSESANLPGTVPSPDFSVGATPAAQSVLPSQSVNYTITLTPTNSSFVYPVSLSVSGLPSGVTASFNPASIPAGSAGTSTVLTLSASASAAIQQRSSVWGAGGESVLALLLLPYAQSKRTRQTARRLSRALIVLLALGAVGALSGCGAGGFFGHPNDNYTVTVTATSGPNTHATNLTLTVQ